MYVAMLCLPNCVHIVRTVMSELYQEQLVTEHEVKQMKLNEHELIFFQCTKPPEVSTNTAAVLIKFGYDENAKKLTGW